MNQVRWLLRVLRYKRSGMTLRAALKMAELAYEIDRAWHQA